MWFERNWGKLTHARANGQVTPPAFLHRLAEVVLQNVDALDYGPDVLGVEGLEGMLTSLLPNNGGDGLCDASEGPERRSHPGHLFVFGVRRPATLARDDVVRKTPERLLFLASSAGNFRDGRLDRGEIHPSKDHHQPPQSGFPGLPWGKVFIQGLSECAKLVQGFQNTSLADLSLESSEEFVLFTTRRLQFLKRARFPFLANPSPAWGRRRTP